MAYSTMQYNPLSQALATRRSRMSQQLADGLDPAQQPSPEFLAQPANESGYLPQAQQAPYGSNTNLNGILDPIQQEIGRSRQDYSDALNNYTTQRTQQRADLNTGLQNSVSAQLNADIPGVKSSLGQLGLLESGAYPEALARRQKELVAQNVLPTLTQFDLGTYNEQNQLPLTSLQREQDLRTGSLQRDFGLQDQASQQAFQGNLADRQASQQQLSSILGLIPGLIGSGGIGGLLGGGGGGGALGGGMAAGGALGGLGGGLGGLGGGAGGSMDLGSLLTRISLGQGAGIRGVVGGGGGGALGSYLGGALGHGSGAAQGIGGGLGALLGGGGLTSGLGAGLGGAFGGSLGAGIGGSVGNLIQPYLLGLLTS